jgi:hypothetical protein
VFLEDEAWLEVSSSTPSTETPIYRSAIIIYGLGASKTHLVVKIIPEVGPSLLDASLLLDDCLFDDARQDAECHGDTVIIIAVNRCASGERFVGFAKDDDTIFKFVGLNAKFG